jgi:polar amino acid transport system substrate-binding protein
LTGYSIDIAHRLAESMGWKLQLVETSWPRLMFGLRTDQYDVIISGLSITPQRARFVQFTQPVGEFDVDAVVNRDKFSQGGLADLRKLTHAKVAAHKGELNADFARSALPNAQILEVDSEDAAIADVRNGKLDAYVAEAPLPHLLEKIYPDKLRALGTEPIARTAHGFAVRKGDTGLLRVLNAWIVYEQASGWLKSRSDYWFEDTGWAADL